MCGRYGLNVNANDLATVYRAIGEDIDGWTPQYSIAPSNTVPILLALPGDPDRDDPRAVPTRPAAPAAVPAAENAVRILEPARWGFRPAWANESGPRPINARLETVASNGMFRASFRAHRAIVPMTGYYEWTPGRGKTKIPHWIHGDAGLLHAAGVTATTTTDGVATTTVAIITTTGTDRAGEIHDRMPVFLTPEILDEWLAPGSLDPTEAEGLVHLAGEQARQIAATLDSHRVDPRVNSVARIDPSDSTLISPADPALIAPVQTLF